MESPRTSICSQGAHKSLRRRGSATEMPLEGQCTSCAPATCPDWQTQARRNHSHRHHEQTTKKTYVQSQDQLLSSTLLRASKGSGDSWTSVASTPRSATTLRLQDSHAFKAPQPPAETRGDGRSETSLGSPSRKPHPFRRPPICR